MLVLTVALAAQLGGCTLLDPDVGERDFVVERATAGAVVVGLVGLLAGTAAGAVVGSAIGHAATPAARATSTGIAAVLGAAFGIGSGLLAGALVNDACEPFDSNGASACR